MDPPSDGAASKAGGGGYASGAHPQPVPSDTDNIKLLVITVNEGALHLSTGVQQKALAVALARNEADAICGVVMARQECVSSCSWDEVLAGSGFSEKVLDEHKLGEDKKENRLCVYTRRKDTLCLLDSFVTSSVNLEKKEFLDKGGVVASFNCRGMRICLGGFHLDGNIPMNADRTAQLPAALLRACARSGGADVALFAGDINCAMGSATLGSARPDSEFGRLLDADIASLQASGKQKGIRELSTDARYVLETALASSSSRAELMKAMDGTPLSLLVETSSLQHDTSWSPETEPQEKMTGCSISELFVQDMSPGSFPTYRITHRGQTTFGDLQLESEDNDVEIQQLHPNKDVSRQCIQECYFDDAKAGVLKKRGDMIRLNLGWLDRLYYGLSNVEGCPVADLHIEQSNPLVLRSSSGTILDHALNSWIATIQMKPV